MKSVSFAIILCCVLDSLDCLEWDSLVNVVYPKTCSRDLFDMPQRANIGDSIAFVSQAESFAFIRQGHRLVKSMEEIDQSSEKEPFPSLALQHFFSSQMPPDVKSSSTASKANLLATRIMYNKKTFCNMTPNSFAAYLEANGFLGLPNKRYLLCKANAAKLQFRTLDGSCNNVHQTAWGAAKQEFTRIAPCNYKDGIYSMPISKSGRALPSPRFISIKVFDGQPIENKVLSAMSVYWGQLIAHDMSMRVMEQHAFGGAIQCCSTDGSRLLTGNALHPSCAPIYISPDDNFYSQHGVLYLNFVRSLTVPNAKNTLGPAEQMNAVSSFIDCSPVYGNDLRLSNQLRTFTGGELKMTENNYPPSVRNASFLCDTSKGQCPCYLTGDSRVNQTPGLTALQTLLIREHNRLARLLSGVNLHWDDERIFQEARRILIAQIQHITYTEWLPLILGRDYIKKHNISPGATFAYDYNRNVNGGVINSFATAAFRFFHTLIPNDIVMIHADRSMTSIRLSDQYMKPCILEHFDKAVDAILKGAAWQSALDADTSFSPEVKNLLFRSTRKWGLDLVAMDIQRGRDHGLGTYNEFRSVCGLKKAESFDDLAEEITIDKILMLKNLYDSVEDIDLFVGGSLEADVYGSAVGPTFQCIIGEQFYRTRVGDRYFYDNGDLPHSFTTEQIKEIKKSTMARLLCNNCNFQEIQKCPFEKLDKFNPEYNCDNTDILPDMNLDYWKEF